MTGVIVAGFGTGKEPSNIYKLNFVKHVLIGGNPKDPEYGFSNTPEEAKIVFAEQMEELLKYHEHDFIFVRRSPRLSEDKDFGSEKIRYRMVGRFSICKESE